MIKCDLQFKCDFKLVFCPITDFCFLTLLPTRLCPAVCRFFVNVVVQCTYRAVARPKNSEGLVVLRLI